MVRVRGRFCCLLAVIIDALFGEARWSDVTMTTILLRDNACSRFLIPIAGTDRQRECAFPSAKTLRHGTQIRLPMLCFFYTIPFVNPSLVSHSPHFISIDSAPLSAMSRSP